MDDQPDSAAARPSVPWQMLAEFVLADATGHDARIVSQLAPTLQALALASAQRNQVQTAVTETLHHLLARTQRSTVPVPVQIRIYCNQAPVTSKPPPTPTDEAQPIAVDAGSWGFFLIEKWGDEAARRHYIIELYLYAERR